MSAINFHNFKTIKRTRFYEYINASLILVFILFLVKQIPWNVQGEMYKLNEFLATCLGFVVGLLSLVRFYSRPDVKFLFIGIGFFGAGIFDGYNVLLNTPLFSGLFQPSSSFFLPWNWFFSRLFLSIFLYLSVRHVSQKNSTETLNSFEIKKIYTLSSVFIFTCLLFFLFVPFPKAYFPTFLIHRPQEMLPAFFFLLALIGYLKKQVWQKDVLEHGLILTLIFSFIIHFLFTSFSGTYFSPVFQTAHVLKNVSYIFVFIGLLISMGQLFRSEEKNRLALKKQNEELDQNKKALEIALIQARESKRIADRKTKSLNASKKAMLNIVDDLNKEKIELAKSKAKDEAILHNVGEGLVVTDLNANVEIINQAALKMIGLKENEVLGKNWNKAVMIIDEDGKAIENKKDPMYLALKNNQNIFNRNFFYLKKGGTPFPVAITASPIMLGDKKTGGILVFRDITHEKEVERTKTEFVSFASHQLRTPLSTINWYTEMILDGDVGVLKPKQKQYLKEVYASCQRMVKLVNDILNVSRLELGTFSIQPEPTKLQDVAEEALRELDAKIHEKKTQLTTHYAADLPSINVDPKLMHIILLNLLSNAIKYTPEKGLVKFRIEKKDPFILITVQDNGYGIPKAQQSKLFTKLFRADNVTAMEIEGTGFGLYIIKIILEKAGGKIWFESRENKGSTFFVQLPVGGMSAKKGEKTLT